MFAKFWCLNKKLELEEVQTYTAVVESNHSNHCCFFMMASEPDDSDLVINTYYGWIIRTWKNIYRMVMVNII